MQTEEIKRLNLLTFHPLSRLVSSPLPSFSVCVSPLKDSKSSYANWVGIHHCGMTSHQNIADVRRLAGERDRIDYLPEQPEQVDQLRRKSIEYSQQL